MKYQISKNIISNIFVAGKYGEFSRQHIHEANLFAMGWPTHISQDPHYFNSYLLLSTGTGGSFPRVKQPRLEAATHLHLVPRLRMCVTIPPLSHMNSWCDT
jgi:hypothetical protein